MLAREAETEAALELALAGVDGEEENRKRMRALEEAELRTGRMAEAAAAAEAQEEASLQRSTDLAQMGRDLEAELAELRRQMLVLELRVAGSGGQAQLVTQGVKAARAIALQLWEESGQQGTRLKAALDAESVGSALAAERAAAPAGAAVALVPGDDGGDDGDGGGEEAALRLEVAACRELIREAAETEAKRAKSLQVMQKMLKAQEESLRRAETLLLPDGWVDAEQVDELLAQAGVWCGSQPSLGGDDRKLTQAV